MRPRSDHRTDEEQISLYESIFAYAGTYTVEGEKVTHRVDIWWNQYFTGTK